jgi:hypothetical protein
MQTSTHEIADRIYRLSICVPDAAPGGFPFNQFLLMPTNPCSSTRGRGACSLWFR